MIDISGNDEQQVDWSVLRRYDWDPNAPHAVYYLSDASGAYLYIGSSHHPEMRLALHRKRPWGSEICNVRVEWYENQAAAFAVEVAAIKKLHPRENKAHKPRIAPMEQAPTNNTPTRPIRIPPVLWTEFGHAVSRSDDGNDRSSVLRDFMRWYVRERSAKLPSRPPRPSRPAEAA